MNLKKYKTALNLIASKPCYMEVSVCGVMWPDVFLSAGELLCMCWNVAEISLHPHPRLSLPLYTTTHHLSSSQSASHTAPSLHHLHISSSLGQSIKLNPCLG